VIKFSKCVVGEGIGCAYLASLCRTMGSMLIS
jgi:hypothetical protein